MNLINKWILGLLDKTPDHNVKWNHSDISALEKTDHHYKIQTFCIQELKPDFNFNLSREKRMILYELFTFSIHLLLMS